jgi:hypothetical protein
MELVRLGGNRRTHEMPPNYDRKVRLESVSAAPLHLPDAADLFEPCHPRQ